MKKQIRLVIMATEEMRIEIGGDNDIDLSTLTKVLSNTMIALNSIAKASVGEDTSCRFVVKNIEKGSFIIDIAQFVTVGVQLFPTFASVIDTFKNVLEIRNALRGEQPKTVMYTGNGNVVINGSGNSVIVNGNAYTIYSNDSGIEKSCAEAVEAFESYVNFAGNKTILLISGRPRLFESYVNFAGNKTNPPVSGQTRGFESYVNFAGNKTVAYFVRYSCMFESYVNFAGNKTTNLILHSDGAFESYVNFAGNKTATMMVAQNGSFESYVNFAGNKTERLIFEN